MESLTTDLSAHARRCSDRPQYGVYIQRQTGRREDEIKRELNVRYVLEGAVQRSGSRMRQANVQLIDAETVDHLWAERFDKPLADLFDMQDEIVSRLANALNAQLLAVEARRAEKAPNPDFDGPLFSGFALVQQGSSTADHVVRAP